MLHMPFKLNPISMLICTIMIFSVAYSYDEKTYWKINDDYVADTWYGWDHSNRIDYYFDVHTHFPKVKNEQEIKSAIENHFNTLSALSVRKMCLFIHSDDWEKYKDVINKDNRIVPFIYIADKEHFTSEYLATVVKEGIKGVKLHSRGMLRDKKYDISFFESEQCQKFYSKCEELKLPIVWHFITALYEKERGKEQPLPFTRKDLLDAQLRICKKHPRLVLIGAHMNDLSEKRLSAIMDEYPNFYVDLSAAASLWEGEHFSPGFKKELQKIYTKHSDRFLFGVDHSLLVYKDTIVASADLVAALRENHWVWYVTESLQRYIKQLDLPQDKARNIAHRNIERILNIPEWKEE